MKKLFPAILLLIGCAKEETEIVVSTRSFVDSEILKKEVLKLKREEVELSFIYHSEERLLETVARRIEDREEIGRAIHLVHQDHLELIEISSTPCLCDPECSMYSEDLCNWWTCVRNTIDDNDVEIGLATIMCPECGAAIISAIGFSCAQQGVSINGN
jgi:hypothetical protein